MLGCACPAVLQAERAAICRSLWQLGRWRDEDEGGGGGGGVTASRQPPSVLSAGGDLGTKKAFTCIVLILHTLYYRGRERGKHTYTHTHTHTHVSVCMYIYMCVCVCVCWRGGGGGYWWCLFLFFPFCATTMFDYFVATDREITWCYQPSDDLTVPGGVGQLAMAAPLSLPTTSWSSS